VTAVQAVLLAISIVMLGYLGAALFKPEWF